jgi:ribose transport system ATP-binding protein
MSLVSHPLLEMRGIVKAFGAVRALRGVDFAVHAGEIVVLLGENGAGKSTLLKMVTGVHAPDAGEILWQGQPVTLDSPARAQALGIRMVYQELNLAPHLSVAANICLGSEPTRGPGILDHRAVRERATRLLEAHRFDLDPDALVGSLGAAQRQLVEICKALAADAKLVLLDEPTSSLGEREIEDLFATLRGLKAKGLGIVYVSHRLPECFAIGDRIVVLRDGEKVYEAPVSETDTATVVRQMVGRDLSAFYPRTAPPEPGPVRLEVEGLSAPPSLNGVSLTARAGEVVGIGGLMGSGRSTLLSALFGLRSAEGVARVDGELLPLRNGSRAAIRRGLGLITEDRKRTGLALGLSVRANITLAALGKIAPSPWLRHDRDRAAARAMIERVGIRTASEETPAGALSGGNQQKVVLARWVFAESSLLLLD